MWMTWIGSASGWGAAHWPLSPWSSSFLLGKGHTVWPGGAVGHSTYVDAAGNWKTARIMSYLPAEVSLDPQPSHFNP